MADAVTSQTLFDGPRIAVMKFTNISDGTGESAVLKVDVSTLSPSINGQACTSVNIVKIYSATHGMGVDILWDATTDLICTTIPQNQFQTMDFNSFGGLINDAGSGKTGDIRFSTYDASSGDRYTITLVMSKNYG
jgi:hypothetical protein